MPKRCVRPTSRCSWLKTLFSLNKLGLVRKPFHASGVKLFHFFVTLPEPLQRLQEVLAPFDLPHAWLRAAPRLCRKDSLACFD